MKLLNALIAGIIAFSFSCVSGKEGASTTASLYNVKWNLKRIYSPAGTEEVSSKAFIKLDEEKKSAGGNGSCNSFGSSVTVSGNEISFKNIFSTKMYCEAVQQTEDAFFKQLEKTNRFEIKDKRLLLYRNKELLLEFESE